MSPAVLSQVALTALGMIALAIILRRLARRLPSPPASQFDLALTREPEPEADLDEITSLQLAFAGAREMPDYLQGRLRPLLRDTAAQRLRERLGIELDQEPERAAAVLGAQAAAFLQVGSARPQRDRRRQAGLSIQTLEAIVSALEAI